ncbi:uncharacterized protein [Montipora foliosa]|uniref:uncharacterized protein n=1 Tax=Montipora foliosa TaxID=591990 RepID=UPI0035F0FD2C
MISFSRTWKTELGTFATGITHWVYASPVLGVVYSDELFLRLLFASGFVLWIVPLVNALCSRLTHVYNIFFDRMIEFELKWNAVKWRLQKAFYHPSGLGKYGCSGLGWSDICTSWISALCQSQHRRPGQLANEGLVPKRALTVADLKGTQPEYISNITVNRWKRDETSEKNYDLLTVSPTSIERVDSTAKENNFKGMLEPEDIKLSDAMATSAAALSTYMGKYEVGRSRFHTLFGLNMGTRMISDIQSVRKETFIKKVLPFVIDILRALPLICVPPVVHYGVVDSDSATKNAVICFIVIHFVLALIAFVHTGSRNPSWREKLAGWFIVHISFVQFVRETFSKNNIGPMPPPILLLSDGGHVENLALLPLLKRRVKKIVVVDGGHKEDEEHYGNSLLNALMLARTYLDCSFLSKDGGDVTSYMLDAFQDPKMGKLPRVFKVPVPKREAMKSELERLVNDQIIAPFTEPTDWAIVQSLFSERTSKLLPLATRLLEPETIPPKNVQQNLIASIQKQAYYYKLRSKALLELQTGETIRVNKPNENTCSGVQEDDRITLLCYCFWKLYYRRNHRPFRLVPPLENLLATSEQTPQTNGKQDLIPCADPQEILETINIHSTMNQFFTSRMFAAYHREGYRACVEAEKDDFMKNFGFREQQSEDASNIV